MAHVRKVIGVMASIEVLLFAGSLWASASDWSPVPSLKLNWVAVVESQTVYGIGPENDLLRRNGDTWSAVPGAPSLRLVTAVPKLLVGVDVDGRLRLSAGNVWLGIAPPSGGSFIRAGIDSAFALYLLEATGALWRGDPSGEDYVWKRIDDRVAMIDVSVSGDLIYAVDREHRLLRRNGDTWFVDPKAPSLDAVAAGGGEVFGVSGADVLRRSGDSWLRVDGPTMRRLSVGTDGTTYGLGPRLDTGASNVWVYVER